MQGQDMVTGLGVAAGFVAGTLVHTSKGLEPIEHLKVGDLVLSKPESGEGDVAYKRVLRTFVSAEKQKIMRMAYSKWRTGPLSERLSSQNLTGDYGYEYLYCTEDHAFWTQEYGWLPLKEISEFGDEDPCTLINCHGEVLTRLAGRNVIDIPLYQTSIPDVAVQVADFLDNIHYDSLIDFRSGYPVILVNVPVVINKLGDFEDKEPNEPYINYMDNPNNFVFNVFNDLDANNNFYYGPSAYYYRNGYNYGSPELSIRKKDEIPRCRDVDEYYHATVYNIDVEDFHTYFVGESAIWVHHKNDNHTQHLKTNQHAEHISNQLE